MVVDLLALDSNNRETGSSNGLIPRKKFEVDVVKGMRDRESFQNYENFYSENFVIEVVKE